MRRSIRWILAFLLVGLSGGLAFAQNAPDPQSEIRNPQSARPELALQVGHSLLVRSVAFSPDGRTVASGSMDYTIKLWDVRTGNAKRTLTAPARVQSVAVSPDGETVASGSSDGAVRLWDVRTGEVKRTLTGHERDVQAVAFSPDGRMLASGSLDKTIKLWDVQTGNVLRALTGPHPVYSIAFSPDGKMLASASAEWQQPGEVRLWDVATGAAKATLTGHRDMVETVAFSPDGKTLASGGMDGYVGFWDVQTGTLKGSLTAHEKGVWSVAFSLDGQTLVSGGIEKMVRLWDAQTGQLKGTLEQGTEVVAVAISPDGRMLASGGSKTVKLWDMQTGSSPHTLTGSNAGVWSVACGRDGRTVACGSMDKTVRLWDVATGNLARTWMGHDHQVLSVAFSPDGKRLATGSADKTVKLWDVATGNVQRTLRGHSHGVQAVTFSPDGRTLATGSYDKTARLWDVESGQPRAILQGHLDLVRTLAFSPDGQTLATGSDDQAVILWDVTTGNARRVLKFNGLVVSVAFSPDGKTFAVAGGAPGVTFDGKTFAAAGGAPGVTLWVVATGNIQRTLERSDSAWCIAFSPDGKTLVGGTLDKKAVKLWEVATGRILRTLTGLQDIAQSIAFSPDGTRVVSGGLDTTVRLWDPISGRQLAAMLPLPEVAEQTAQARPIEVGAKPIEMGAKAIEIGAKDALAAANEWFVVTPEGYFDCSANAARFIRWNVNGELYPAERYLRRFRRPDLVRKALSGEKIEAPEMTAEDVPPTAQFISLKYDGPTQNEAVTVTVEASGLHDLKEVLLLVNGRPLPPQQARKMQVKAAPANLQARPIELGAKAIELGAKALEVGAKPIEVGAKPAGSNATQPTPNLIVKRFSFQVPLPLGAENVRLRAVAYDSSDLGSNPAEIALKRPGVKAVPGKLYALCVGLSRYKNGRGQGSGVGVQGFSNLKFPAKDAQSVVERILKEGKPLYESVEVCAKRALVDEQATLANIRAGLNWLQAKVRPGQVDTVVVFLSGHGVSDPQGHYYFPTYEFDRSEFKATSLSGRELQEALGGALRAKSVFLFVDTCHSGALTGTRGDDLNFDVNNSGVYMMASSGATQYSYESPEWGHGAFSYALLRSLGKRELAREGVIHFNVLTYAVPEELAALMEAVGQNEAAMQPVVPLEGRWLDEPVAQVR